MNQDIYLGLCFPSWPCLFKSIVFFSIDYLLTRNRFKMASLRKQVVYGRSKTEKEIGLSHRKARPRNADSDQHGKGPNNIRWEERIGLAFEKLSD